MQTDRGIYHKRVCDRCGAVLGGRMMNPDEYFKDWAWRRDTGDLCPECYAEYKRETAKRCNGDALDGVSDGIGGLNMTNKKFGIIIMDLSLFDFGPKPPCGYIKAKHIRPAYGKGTRPVKAHKRITRTREGFRK